MDSPCFRRLYLISSIANGISYNLLPHVFSLSWYHVTNPPSQATLPHNSKERPSPPFPQIHLQPIESFHLVQPNKHTLHVYSLHLNLLDEYYLPSSLMSPSLVWRGGRIDVEVVGFENGGKRERGRLDSV